MITLGIDIGSATSKCVLLRDGKDIIASAVVNGGIGTEGSEEAKAMVMSQSGINPEDIDYVVATGYGRSLYEQADAQISELSCHAIGAHAIFPDVRTVIDIGGQDVKVMALDEHGRMKDFLMNDKCAAGTGRFLEVMANVLRMGVDELEVCAAKGGETRGHLQHLHRLRRERGHKPAGQRRLQGRPGRRHLRQRGAQGFRPCEAHRRGSQALHERRRGPERGRAPGPGGPARRADTVL